MNVGCGPPGLHDVGVDFADVVVLVVDDNLLVVVVVRLGRAFEVVHEYVPEEVLGVDVHEPEVDNAERKYVHALGSRT